MGALHYLHVISVFPSFGFRSANYFASEHLAQTPLFQHLLCFAPDHLTARAQNCNRALRAVSRVLTHVPFCSSFCSILIHSSSDRAVAERNLSRDLGQLRYIFNIQPLPESSRVNLIIQTRSPLSAARCAQPVSTPVASPFPLQLRLQSSHLNVTAHTGSKLSVAHGLSRLLAYLPGSLRPRGQPQLLRPGCLNSGHAHQLRNYAACISRSNSILLHQTTS